MNPKLLNTLEEKNLFDRVTISKVKKLLEDKDKRISGFVVTDSKGNVQIIDTTTSHLYSAKQWWAIMHDRPEDTSLPSKVISNLTTLLHPPREENKDTRVEQEILKHIKTSATFNK